MLIRSHELGIYIQILNSLKRQEKWEKLNQGFYGPHDCQAVADFEAAIKYITCVTDSVGQSISFPSSFVRIKMQVKKLL